MRQIIGEDQSFVREEHSVREGLEIFVDQPYKQEIIEGVEAAISPGTGSPGMGSPGTGSPGTGRDEKEVQAEAVSEGAGPSGVSTYRNYAAAPGAGAGADRTDFVDLCRGPHVPPPTWSI